jgi:hypothetical protein
MIKSVISKQELGISDTSVNLTCNRFALFPSCYFLVADFTGGEIL